MSTQVREYNELAGTTWDLSTGDCFLLLREVETVPTSHTALCRKIAADKHSYTKSLGAQIMRWLESRISEWIEPGPAAGS